MLTTRPWSFSVRKLACALCLGLPLLALPSCIDASVHHRLVRVSLDDEDEEDAATKPQDDDTDDSDDSGDTDDDQQDDGASDSGMPEPEPEASVRDAQAEIEAATEASIADAEPGSPADATPEASTGAWVKVGIPDATTGIEFVEIADGDDIPIQMGGQGGTHARIALQVQGFGNRVFYQVFLKNLDGEGEVATLPLTRARPIACDDEDVCRIGPLFVLLGGLAPSDEWEGLHVEATAVVRNEDGVEASGKITGVLQWFEED
jgi:hypothetical protein